jgi:hypothetical protein
MSRKLLTCPDCGLPIEDATAIRLGFCGRCAAFTAMCAAGRKIVSPDVMSVTSWHMPCTVLGAVEWELTWGGRKLLARLCPEHDAQLRAGGVHWIEEAVRLEELAAR